MTINGKLPGVGARRKTAEERFSAIIDPIEETFSGWTAEDNRATTSLYSLLGKIFAASALIDGDVDLLYDLRRRVRKHPDIKGKKAYKPEKKKPLDLLLTVVLGTKQHKGRKSQWRSAILGAPATVAKDEESFVAWISQPGMGLTGARKAYRKSDAAPQKKGSLSQYIESIGAPSDDAPLLQLDLPSAVAIPTDEYVVALLKKVPSEEGGDRQASFRLVRLVSDAKPVTVVARYAAVNPELRAEDLIEAQKLNLIRDPMWRSEALKYSKGGPHDTALAAGEMEETPEGGALDDQKTQSPKVEEEEEDEDAALFAALS